MSVSSLVGTAKARFAWMGTAGCWVGEEGSGYHGLQGKEMKVPLSKLNGGEWIG